MPGVASVCSRSSVAAQLPRSPNAWSDFGAGVVEADVVGGPFGAERLALGGELADEVCEVAVVWAAAGFGAKDGDDLIGEWSLSS